MRLAVEMYAHQYLSHSRICTCAYLISSVEDRRSCLWNVCGAFRKEEVTDGMWFYLRALS